VDGREYLDLIGSWGATILGHADPAVVDAVRTAALDGFALGATHPLEVELGEAITAAMPSIERLRFTSSGTEAVMSAVRLARAATGRELILKFAGAYHGHSDGLLVEAGSGVATLAMPGSAGVPEVVAARTIVLPFNDPDAVRAAFAAHPGAIAAVITEPVVANAGVIAPQPGFLQLLREATLADGALLVFDEVITGFRLGPGGAQARFGVRPDLTTLGKIIGGGMAIGAYGGRRDLMDLVAPVGPVYQAGTLSGHPLAMAAGIATLKQLPPERYAALERRVDRLVDELRDAATTAGRAVAIARSGPLLTLFFRDGIRPTPPEHSSRIGPPTRGSSAACSTPGCSCRPHRSRHGSRASPTARPRSTGSSRRPGSRSPHERPVPARGSVRAGRRHPGLVHAPGRSLAARVPARPRARDPGRDRA
jgi:glutamate-1-semialdehyde 2,1-aminomutase